MYLQEEISKRGLDIQAQIRDRAATCHRDPEDITLVAVSKTHPAEAVRILAGLGHAHFGENYVQEALDKQDELSDLNLTWHFIGRLQSNKAKYLPGRFGLIHSLDRVKTAQVLHDRCAQAGLQQRVLIQVNVAGEQQKGGVPVSDLSSIARDILAMPTLQVQGLMCMPPFFDDPEASRPFFRRLRQERDRVQEDLGVSLPHLSMGMSGDYLAAIEEGSTLVRIGTSIFGQRDL